MVVQANAVAVIFDVVLGFPAAPAEWWRDGSVFMALCKLLREHRLWFGFHNVGLAGDPLARITGDARLGNWSTTWEPKTTYRLAPVPTRADSWLDLDPRDHHLRMYLRLAAKIVEPRRRDLLDSLVAWLGAVRRSSAGGGVRVQRGDVTVDAEGPQPLLRRARAWNTGSMMDVIDRDTYAAVVASNYFHQRYATEDEGEAELTRILAAPVPAGTVRLEDGPLIVWKHVADLTDAAAIDRARTAQQAWIAGLVPTEGGD